MAAIGAAAGGPAAAMSGTRPRAGSLKLPFHGPASMSRFARAETMSLTGLARPI